MCDASLTDASLMRFIRACLPLLKILAVQWKLAERNGSVLDSLQCPPCKGLVCRVWREERALPGGKRILPSSVLREPSAVCERCGRSEPRFDDKDMEFFEKKVKKMLAMAMGIEWDG